MECVGSQLSGILVTNFIQMQTYQEITSMTNIFLAHIVNLNTICEKTISRTIYLKNACIAQRNMMVALTVDLKVTDVKGALLHMCTTIINQTYHALLATLTNKIAKFATA
jgi:hypothetical protein